MTPTYPTSQSCSFSFSEQSPAQKGNLPADGESAGSTLYEIHEAAYCTVKTVDEGHITVHMEDDRCQASEMAPHSPFVHFTGWWG